MRSGVALGLLALLALSPNSASPNSASPNSASPNSASPSGAQQGPASPAVEPAASVFARGVAAYEAGRFAESEREFRSLLEAGRLEAPVFHNMGNAAYRRGRFAVAVWAFEQARRLDPADVHAAENLRFARAQLVSDELPGGLSAGARRALDLLGRVPLLPLALAFLVPWTLAWLLATWRLRGGPPSLTGPALALFLLAGLLALPLAVRAIAAAGPAEGVLLAPEVVVRSGPGEAYAARFELHAGTILQELERRGDWLRVRVPHGPEGWVAARTLAVFGRPETLPPDPS